MSEKERILNKILNDKSRPVEFKDCYGGSENQLRLLFKHVPDEYFKGINLILNNTNPNLIDKDIRELRREVSELKVLIQKLINFSKN